MIHKELRWTGDQEHLLDEWKDLKNLLVYASCEPHYVATMFRFLTLLKRVNDCTIILSPEMEETAENTGFSNLNI